MSSKIRNFTERAEMLVQVQGDKDGTKHFEVVSEDGWKAAHKHVLRQNAGVGERKRRSPETARYARLNFDKL